jgi:hypothetical protein
MNEALILKLLWQLAQGKDALWVRIMQAKHCEGAICGKRKSGRELAHFGEQYGCSKASSKPI